jgi:hypothetical protein
LYDAFTFQPINSPPLASVHSPRLRPTAQLSFDSNGAESAVIVFWATSADGVSAFLKQLVPLCNVLTISDGELVSLSVSANMHRSFTRTRYPVLHDAAQVIEGTGIALVVCRKRLSSDKSLSSHPSAVLHDF